MFSACRIGSDTHGSFTAGVNSKKEACFGEIENSSGNLKILPGIGRKFSGIHVRRKKVTISGSLSFFAVIGKFMSPKNLGRCSRFSGGLLFAHGSVQSAVVKRKVNVLFKV